jgi:hypothetical protein
MDGKPGSAQRQTRRQMAVPRVGTMRLPMLVAMMVAALSLLRLLQIIYWHRSPTATIPQ